MKKLLLLAFGVIPFFCYPQGSLSQSAAQQYAVINENAFIDNSDMTVYNLLNAFYKESLNSDAGEVSQKTIDQVKKIMADNNFPNRNLLEILLFYQDQLRLMAERNEKPNTSFQILTTDVLATQSEKIYGKVPVLIQIYKGETFMVAYMDDKAQAIFKEILVSYPDCIPARVYNCMLTTDEAEKQRLSAALKKERPNHWMVKQFLK
jgi:hypothetical protein